MTTTSVETVTITKPQLGRILYLEPETSHDPWDCDYFALPRARTLTYHTHQLHDLRSTIFQNPSPYTLATHAFTAVRHKSILHTPPHTISDFYTATTLTEHYIPEVETLVKTVTGAKKVFVLNVAVRSQVAMPLKTVSEIAATATTEEPERCGIKIDKTNLDFTKPMIPDQKQAKEGGTPVRSIHIDYSPAGARSMLRNTRLDIIEEAKDIFASEDEALASGKPYQGRRYAIYSIWRPLKTVKRDPLVLCDPNSIDRKRDLIEDYSKRPGVNGDFIGGVLMLSGFHAEEQKWYWLEEQREDEVYFLQFYDSFAEREGRHPGVPHGSPELVGVECSENRESIESRVVAFW